MPLKLLDLLCVTSDLLVLALEVLSPLLVQLALAEELRPVDAEQVRSLLVHALLVALAACAGRRPVVVLEVVRAQPCAA